MEKNIGSTDRTVRIVIGLGLLASYFFLPAGIKYLAAIGLVPLVTAFIGWCPLWTVFRVNTNRRQAN